MNRIALQLYSVRESLVEDLDATVARVRQIGYTAVEAMFWPDIVSVDALAGRLRREGLQACSLHVPLPDGENIAALARAASELETTDIVWHGWPRDPRHDSLEGVLELAHSYRDAAALSARNGLRLSLHNHWWEFQSIAGDTSGNRPIDLWKSELGTAVGYELDTYWIRVAGADPVSELQALPAPPHHVHLKDGPGDTESAKTALGTGVLPLDALIPCIPSDTWKIVEMDDCDTDIWTALAQSRLTLIG